MPRLLSFIFLLIISASCSVKEKPVTKEEALIMSRAIDSSIRNKKPGYFNSLISEDAFTEKVAKSPGTKSSAGMRRGIKTALEKSDLGDKIIRASRTNGSYELVKQYEKDKIQHLIFRLYSDDGLNYHDFELTKKNGKPAIADIFIYLSGEDLSKTIADLFTNFSASEANGSGKKLAAQVEKIKNMKELVERKEPEKALKYYNALPADLKDQKSIRLMHIMLCSQLDEDTYLKAIDDYLVLYPDAPNMHLLLVDTYIMRKEYAKAIGSIDKVDRLINSDPFLDYMRALMYNLMDKPVEARTHLEKLYHNMPGFDDGALELIANYIDAGDDDKARELIKEYEANKDYDQSLLDNYLSVKSFNREE
ncbi:MAG: tetratricopeptide repeat protein [Chitinophagaceae bacterium]